MASDGMRVRLHLRQIRVLAVVVDTPCELVVEVESTVRRPRCPACGFRCDTELRRLCERANPALLSACGVGAGAETAAPLLIAAGDNPERMHSEASFAALCGTSPVEASSGPTLRHRLNRGGNRCANNALWRIAMVRLRFDERSIAYAARLTAEGKTRREILRCLKRHIAREVYKLRSSRRRYGLRWPTPSPSDGSDRPAANSSPDTHGRFQ